MGLLHLPSPIPHHDLFFIILHAAMDSIAFVENIILILAIIHRSPSSLKSYAVLLMYCALIDLIAAIALPMIMVRVIPAGEIAAYVYDGPCVAVSGFFCHCLYCVTLATYSQSLVFVAISFAYRLYVLERPTPTRWQVLLICALISAPNVIVMSTIAPFSLDNSDKVRQALALAKPDYDLGDYAVEGHLNISTNWKILLICAIMCLPSGPTLVAVFVLRAKVLAKITQNSSKMSVNTIRLHRALTKVLTIQAMLPIIISIGVANYVLCQLDVVCSPVQEHLIMLAASFVPFLSPAVTLYYVQPYRSFVEEKIFCMKKRKITTVDAIGDSSQPKISI